jgi:hypothetical protein
MEFCKLRIHVNQDNLFVSFGVKIHQFLVLRCLYEHDMSPHFIANLNSFLVVSRQPCISIHKQFLIVGAYLNII